MKPPSYIGKLTTWQDDRGFGFIQGNDGSKEVFLHISEVKNNIRRPQVGDVIRYQITSDNKGKVRAVEAMIEGATQKLAFQRKKTQDRSTSSVNLPIFGLQLLLLASMPLGGSIKLALTTSNIIPLMVYSIMSFITFGMYRQDKLSAQQGKRRIPEKTLHFSELAGGWFGGFIAQQTLRHKSIKQSYQLVFWVIVVIHLFFWLDWLFLGKIILKSLFR